MACYLAVRKVCTNSGFTTPGVDGYIPKTRNDYMDLINRLSELDNDTYKASPLRRIWFPKPASSTDKRGISIPTIFDRCVQADFSLPLWARKSQLLLFSFMGFSVRTSKRGIVG